jgi:hypothetical protein
MARPVKARPLILAWRIEARAFILALRIEALAVLAILTDALLGLIALRLSEHPGVVLGMLQEALGGHAVAGQVRVTRQRLVLVDDLLRGAPHLAVGACALEDAVDDIANVAPLVVVVIVIVVAGLVPGTLLVRWSHAEGFRHLSGLFVTRPGRRVRPAAVAKRLCTCTIRPARPKGNFCKWLDRPDLYPPIRKRQARISRRDTVSLGLQ